MQDQLCEQCDDCWDCVCDDVCGYCVCVLYVVEYQQCEYEGVEEGLQEQVQLFVVFDCMYFYGVEQWLQYGDCDYEVQCGEDGDGNECNDGFIDIDVVVDEQY